MDIQRIRTEEQLRVNYLQSLGHCIKTAYGEEVLRLLDVKQIDPTHFVTLMFNKNVSEPDCMSAYAVFLKLLSREVFGSHNKRRFIKQVTVLERHFNSSYHIHGLFECDVETSKLPTSDHWKQTTKRLWSYKIKKGSRVGISETKNYFIPIDDEDDLSRYVTKHFDNDGGQLICL